MRYIIKKGMFAGIGMIIFLGGGTVFSQFNISNPENKKQDTFIKAGDSQEAVQDIQEVIQTEKELSVPPPLQLIDTEKATDESSVNADPGLLDSKSVIAFTNIQRQRFGLAPLSENLELDSSAEMKANDILEKQYFEHVSPDGIGIKDLSQENGYDYILIGENLAMGDFKSDRSLVEAWMASPGHRANILKSRYNEIGVSVKRGTYKGKTIWVAVQHFGLSLENCSQIDSVLKNEITSQKSYLETEAGNLKALNASMEGFLNKASSEYEKKVEEYNGRIKAYNQAVKELEEKTAEYNNQVKLFNGCVRG